MSAMMTEIKTELDRSCGSDAVPCSALQAYAFDVISNFKKALESRPWEPTHSVPTIAIMGAIQLIQAGIPNLRDAERVTALARIGATWIIKVDGKEVGIGEIRDAIDQASAICLPNAGHLAPPTQDSNEAPR